MSRGAISARRDTSPAWRESEGFAKGLRLLALVRMGTLGVTVELLVHSLLVPIVEAGVAGVVPGAATLGATMRRQCCSSTSAYLN